MKSILMKGIKWSLVLFVIALGGSIFLFYTFKKNSPKKEQPQKHVAGDYTRELLSFDDFSALQGEPLSNKFNDVWSVKMVYEIGDQKLYFLNSLSFRYHYEFCNRVLRDNANLMEFNIANYGKFPQRRYYLANLNYYIKSHIYAMEFASDDQISAAQIQTFFGAIKAHSYLGDSLHVLISSGYLSEMDQSGALPVAKIYPTDIYQGQLYQSLNTGETYGYLQLVENLSEKYTTVQPGDIVITKGTPVNVPVCVGIITDMYQTPLSHINVLCHNRDIPSAVDIGVWNKKSLQALQHKPVKLVVTGDSYSITATTAAQADSFLSSRKREATISLKYDLSKTAVIPVTDFDLKSKNFVGNKAAGLGELNKIAAKKNSYFNIPEGAFAIPFFYYNQHIQQPEIKMAITTLLRMPANSDPEAIHQQLKKVRKAIKEASIDKKLLEAVEARIAANHTGKSYRFRSSSNAEDRDGFSGAGLYDSKTGISGDTAKSIEDAIKGVWASTWSDAAFRERSWYHIDHNTSMMGILVHRNFPDEAANGVAITKNLYRKGFPGFTINVQTGETSVVSPPDSVTCEQFICMSASDINPLNDDITADYLTYSNINRGQPVLSRVQIVALYQALAKVKSHMYSKQSFLRQGEFLDYGLDVEFKFERNGRLYLKQVRPYR